MKEFLSRKGVKFSEYDVAKDQRACDEMVQKTGRLAVPTIRVGNDVLVGFNPAELEKLLH
ncbi:MAG: glutaredoxin family protein [Firmicutes bacterium]|nr:glutaredoxin family protein [Bacillota bacterium]